MGVLGLLACQVLILILLRGEAHQALSVNVDAQRVVASHHDIEPQIKFMTLDQEWIVKVPRYHTSFILYHISQIVDDINASTTA